MNSKEYAKNLQESLDFLENNTEDLLKKKSKDELLKIYNECYPNLDGKGYSKNRLAKEIISFHNAIKRSNIIRNM